MHANDKVLPVDEPVREEKASMHSGMQRIWERLGRSGPGQALLRRAEMALAGRPERRLLGVWWFQTLSGSIGDATIFHEILLCLKEEYGLDRIDVAFIDDAGHVNNRESRYHLGQRFKDNVVSMCCVNPCLGSVFRFDAWEEFLRFARVWRRRYVFHPAWDATGEIGLDARIRDLFADRPRKTGPGDFVLHRLPYDPRQIALFYARHGSIPRESCRRETLEQVRAFLAEHVFPARPVVIQIRHNPMRECHKNISLDLWLSLIDSRRQDPNIRFIVIGHPEELADSRLDRPNVIRSKQHFSSIEADLALIQTSRLAIFNPGGLANFSWYAGTPSLTFHADYRQLPELTGIPPNGRLPYHTPYQRLFWGEPDKETILREFDRLVTDLDRAETDGPPA